MAVSAHGTEGRTINTNPRIKTGRPITIKKTKAPIRSYRCVGQLVKYLPAVAASKSQRIMPRSATALDPLSRQRDWLCPQFDERRLPDVKSKGGRLAIVRTS